jgi:NADH-quinone oxidoreductase subunit J
VMLTRNLMDRTSRSVNRQWPFAAGAAVLMFAVLTLVVLGVQWPAASLATPSATFIADLGEAMMGSYLIPFEVVSTLLLVALVGSIIIARER